MPKSLLDLINESHRNGPSIVFSDAVVASMYDGTFPAAESLLGMVWLGAWSGATLYLEGDGVSSAGSTYIAIHDNLNSQPPSGNWDLVASKGDTGVQGIQGTAGAQGNAGADGAAGAAGPNTVTGATTTTLTGLLKGNGSVVSVASAPGDYVATGDSRLSDARTPTAHTHPISEVTSLQTTLDGKQPIDTDLTTIAGLTATTDNFMVATASAWASRTPTQARSQLGLGSLATQSGTFSGTSSGTNTGDQTLPVKATGAEVDTGTDDAKFLTPKAIEDSLYIKAAYADAKVADAINDGTTTIAPSQNVVFDQLALKAPISGPTFTGTVTIPTPFTLGAVSVLPTGTELNFVDGVTSAIQTQIDSKQATLVSATNIKTINGSTVLGSGDLTVGGAQPDIVSSMRAPTADQTIAANYSVVVNRKFTIASAKKLSLGSGAIFRIH